MRALLFCSLVVIGCSKKSETKSEPAPAKQEPAAEPAKTPAEEKKAEAPPPAPPAPAANVDCAALVTAEDVAKACGGTKVEVGTSQMEGKSPTLGVCSRVLTEPGKKFPIAHVHLNVFPDPAGAETWVKLEKTEEAKEVAGLGDFAWSRVAEVKGLKSTEYDLGVRKGRSILKLSMTQNSLNKKLPCTMDQLTELARMLAPRMP